MDIGCWAEASSTWDALTRYHAVITTVDNQINTRLRHGLRLARRNNPVAGAGRGGYLTLSISVYLCIFSDTVESLQTVYLLPSRTTAFAEEGSPTPIALACPPSAWPYARCATPLTKRAPAAACRCRRRLGSGRRLRRLLWCGDRVTPLMVAQRLSSLRRVRPRRRCESCTRRCGRGGGRGRGGGGGRGGAEGAPTALAVAAVALCVLGVAKRLALRVRYVVGDGAEARLGSGGRWRAGRRRW